MTDSGINILADYPRLRELYLWDIDKRNPYFKELSKRKRLETIERVEAALLWLEAMYKKAKQVEIVH